MRLAYVPLEAKSAATLLCLAADELVLGELGELGPLDAQLHEKTAGDAPRFRSCLERFKALEQLQRYSMETFDIIVQVVLTQGGMRLLDACNIAAEFTGRVCGPMYEKIDPDSLGQSARYLEVSNEYARRVLRRYRPDLHAAGGEAILEKLVRGYPSHEFVIDMEELSELGVPARHPNEDEAPLLHELESAFVALGERELVQLVRPKESALPEDAASAQVRKIK